MVCVTQLATANTKIHVLISIFVQINAQNAGMSVKHKCHVFTNTNAP